MKTLGRPEAEGMVDRGVSATPSDTSQRYHALDLLRGMMMLGLVAFHTALPYAAWPNPEAGSLLEENSELLSYYVYVGGLRISIFFVLAGFFCALLFSRRTLGGFVSNAGVRIGMPLGVGWVVLSPFIGAGLLFSVLSFMTNKGFAWDVAWQLGKDGEFLFPNTTYHLWFLYYLLFFYAGFLVLRVLIERSSLIWPAGQSLARRIVEWPWRVSVLALPTILLLQIQPLREETSPLSWTPDWRFILLYGSLFATGAILFSVRDGFERFKHGAWWNMAAGLFLYGIFQALRENASETGLGVGLEHAMMDVANGLFIWFFFFGITGVLLTYLNRPNRAARYVADAAYWCFLFHIVLVAWLPGVLATYTWSPFVKFLVAFAIVTAVCFATYELFVRWSIIGRVLNGRMYPSGLAAWVRRLRGPACDREVS